MPLAYSHDCYHIYDYDRAPLTPTQWLHRAALTCWPILQTIAVQSKQPKRKEHAKWCVPAGQPPEIAHLHKCNKITIHTGMLCGTQQQLPSGCNGWSFNELVLICRRSQQSRLNSQAYSISKTGRVSGGPLVAPERANKTLCSLTPLTRLDGGRSNVVCRKLDPSLSPFPLRSLSPFLVLIVPSVLLPVV